LEGIEGGWKVVPGFTRPATKRLNLANYRQGNRIHDRNIRPVLGQNSTEESFFILADAFGSR
jgi:hypothetical protein